VLRSNNGGFSGKPIQSRTTLPARARRRPRLFDFCIPDIGPDQGLVVGAGAVPLRSTAVEVAADGRVSGPKPGTYTPCGGEAVGAGGAGS
jgi:hypothetical protein